MKKILIVDDDEELCGLLEDCLSLEGFCCGFAGSGTLGIEKISTENWDLVVLDIMLPGCSGLDVLRFLRASANCAMPVLMLTAKSDEMDRIFGLEQGADDYLTKPFSCRELAARIRAILRRHEFGAGVRRAPSHMQTIGDLSLNRSSMRVSINNEIIPSTTLEFNLLEILLKNAGNVVARETLAQEALGRSLNPLERTVDVHVSRIRGKIGNHKDGSPRIRSVRGEGYVYLPPDTP